MPSAKLKKFLDANSIRYLTLQHSLAYTAQELAARMHIHGWELAKTTILKVDGKFCMAVLPAPCQVDLTRFRDVTGAETVVLAAEEEFRKLFPECEAGAMPPFGNLYGLAVYVDERLAEDESIVFNAGTHTEAIRMAFADFDSLVKPEMAHFGVTERASPS
jgi:Ala-tRNA(Pro) deacylase